MAEQSDASPNPRKRPRVDDDPTSLSRDDAFWYEDGNIVLVAQNVGFRIYKGWLSNQSDVFRDMCSLPQPAPSLESQAADEWACQCPVVYLTDTAFEVRSLLTVLVDARQFMRRTYTFDDIASWIRLSHKYHIETLLEDALAQLKVYFPATLSEWDEDRARELTQYAISAVNLARLTDTLSVLPAALYACCQLDAHVLVTGRLRPDGLVDVLSPDDLAWCVAGKARMCSRFMGVITDVVFAPLENPDCTCEEDDCDKLAEEARKQYVQHPSCVGRCSLLNSWAGVLDPLRKGSPRVCKPCMAILRARGVLVREQAWADLSVDLGLPQEKTEVDAQDADAA